MSTTSSESSNLAEDLAAFLQSRGRGLRMDIPDRDIIEEAFVENHAEIENKKTTKQYRECLLHFSEFLESKCSKNFYGAERVHVKMFMDHLAEKGGSQPAASRDGCSWCEARGYPDGKLGHGWSLSTQKKYMAAIRYLYFHFQAQSDLPDRNPSSTVKSPKWKKGRSYKPTADEIRSFLKVSGSPTETLLAYWMAYSPERRASFRQARWADIDLDARLWEIFDAENDKSYVVDLHPIVVNKLRHHRNYQLTQGPKVRAALKNEDTAFVLLTENGAPIHESSLTKMIKRRGIRAKVGIVSAPGQSGSVAGLNSKMTPHALRRGWASSALNDGVPIDVVSKALGHADIGTTRRHYASTEPGRVRDALTTRNY